MYKKNIDIIDDGEINILPQHYKEIKRDYLCRKESKYGLYKKYFIKYNIDKDTFMEILNLIRCESKMPVYGTKRKDKRKHNPFSFHDKHPKSYKINGTYENNSGFRKNETHLKN
ncbi:hypothetical protein [Methanobrevibacter sp. DSM 116169]|uniref:hypothetical protein n=1 Tax=Methanobrevibacter sp. DSM 116169 TaxID=3242727 RepID=UPI0038FCF091